MDDAALFPPGNAPMAAAVTHHRRVPDRPYAWLVGRFLCPASRLPELRTQLAPGDEIGLGLIADTGVPGLPAALEIVRDEPRLSLELIEIALPADVDQTQAAASTLKALPETVPAHVELPRVPGWRPALDLIGAAGRGAKLRTGGLKAELFPSPQEVAAFITACQERGVPFKCTAGLHHAVRHTDPATGFHHHGFLNILLATARAITGQAPAEALATEDAQALAAEALAIPTQVADAARALFVAYGSCSLSDPYDDLDALDLKG